MEIKELGHIVLYVHNLDRSRYFYETVLGWHAVTPEGYQRRACAFTSGRTHHELLLLEVGSGATPIPPPPRLGMYHFGLKIGESDDELREALETLQREGATIIGTADHTVTHSLYIADPDGNEIELFCDAPREEWEGRVAESMTVRPLDLD